jgi:DNA-directed RNA polymerase subunit RPC12/RpoP
MPIDAASWYVRDLGDDSLYQGDVVGNVPVVFMPPAGDGPWTILRPSPPQTVEQVLAGQTPRVLKPHAESARPDAWQLGQDLVLAKGIRKSVMIVTQSCDLVSRNWIQVAPVFPGLTIADPAKRASLAINEIGYMFVLPADPPRMTEDSYAELSMITSVHKSYLRRIEPTLRLTSTTRALLQKHLANLHGRPFSFNLRDTVPQTGEYLCHRCFLNIGEIAQRQHEQGQPFGECPRCGVDALWMLRAEG